MHLGMVPIAEQETRIKGKKGKLFISTLLTSMSAHLSGYALHLICTVSSAFLNSIFLDERNP